MRCSPRPSSSPRVAHLIPTAWDAVAQPARVAQLGDARRARGLDLDRDDGAVGPLDAEVDLVALMVAVVVQPEPVARLRGGAEYLVHDEALQKRAGGGRGGDGLHRGL